MDLSVDSTAHRRVTIVAETRRCAVSKRIRYDYDESEAGGLTWQPKVAK